MEILVNTGRGDAYGAGFEYASDQFVKQNNNLSGYVKNQRHNLQPGMYTDDTQMSIATAEMIVAGLPWTGENLAEAFVNCFKRDAREGYAGGFYKLLCSVKDGKEFLERIVPNSDKSGAAMRAVPIGIFSTVEEVKEKSALQAALTHNTADGINAAVAASLIGHYFLYQLGPKSGLGHFLETHVPGEWSKPWSGKVGEKGWMSVRAAVTAIIASSRMSELLLSCVAFTGDVDTVAAIALGAASASPEITQDLPSALIVGLENGAYGSDFLKALDLQLARRFLELSSQAKPPQQ